MTADLAKKKNKKRDHGLDAEELEAEIEDMLIDCLEYCEEFFDSFARYPKLGLINKLVGKRAWRLNVKLRRLMKTDLRFGVTLQDDGSFRVSSSRQIDQNAAKFEAEFAAKFVTEEALRGK